MSGRKWLRLRPLQKIFRRRTETFNDANLIKQIKEAHKQRHLTVVQTDSAFYVTNQHFVAKVSPRLNKVMAAITECVGVFGSGTCAGVYSGEEAADFILKKWNIAVEKATRPVKYTRFCYTVPQKSHRWQKENETVTRVLNAGGRLITLNDVYLNVLDSPHECSYATQKEDNQPTVVVSAGEGPDSPCLLVLPCFIDMKLPLEDLLIKS